MQRILVLNILISLIIFVVAARLYILPRVNTKSLVWIAPPILLLNAMRHLGLMFIAPGVTLPGLSTLFAYPAAIGDFITAILALSALYVLRTRPSRALPWLWAFNIFGSLDFMSSIALANIAGAAPFLGAAYWIPAFWVPMLITSHYIMYVQLLRARSTSTERNALTASA
jgi:hypothetical protein